MYNFWLKKKHLHNEAQYKEMTKAEKWKKKKKVHTFKEYEDTF